MRWPERTVWVCISAGKPADSAGGGGAAGCTTGTFWLARKCERTGICSAPESASTPSEPVVNPIESMPARFTASITPRISATSGLLSSALRSRHTAVRSKKRGAVAIRPVSSSRMTPGSVVRIRTWTRPTWPKRMSRADSRGASAGLFIIIRIVLKEFPPCILREHRATAIRRRAGMSRSVPITSSDSTENRLTRRFRFAPDGAGYC